jgi:hypothetical protein
MFVSLGIKKTENLLLIRIVQIIGRNIEFKWRLKNWQYPFLISGDFGSDIVLTNFRSQGRNQHRGTSQTKSIRVTWRLGLHRALVLAIPKLSVCF